jgi:hypothetical protein
LTDLQFEGAVGVGAQIHPSTAEILFGPAGGFIYGSVTGPTSFGAGPATASSFAFGSNFGVVGEFQNLLVPAGYQSNTPLSATDFFDNATLASLGLLPGTYTWTWGSGAHADSFEVIIGATPLGATPLPAALPLFATGLGVMGLFGWRRKRKGATAAA